MKKKQPKSNRFVWQPEDIQVTKPKTLAKK